MPSNNNQCRRSNTMTLPALVLLVCFFPLIATPQERSEITDRNLIQGHWIINDELSDNTDDKVEAAIKADGGRIRRNWFSRKEEDRYRGGPANQELYDRISYDDVLTIKYSDPEFLFEYADGYQRLFHNDGRRRSIGASQFYQDGAEDFSFANWEGEILTVEARPRDGGFTLESYALQLNGQQLRVELEINPSSFNTSIILLRIYDRYPSAQ